MNMALRQAQYVRGEIVGYVLGRGDRLELPLPQRWYIRQAQAGRDAKVMTAFRQRDVSAYSPQIIRVIDRRNGGEARRPHFGRVVIKPMLPGLIFIPDFDVGHHALDQINYLEGWLQLGPELASLSSADMLTVRRIEALLNVPRGQRKYAIGELVRVVEGPLADFVGKVERLDSGGRLKVFIAALMSGASVIVDEAQVEPVSQRSARATARRPKRKRGCSSA